MKSNRTSSGTLITTFTITFLNLVGFGIVIPLLPFYGEQFGARPVDVGLLISSYAAAQFISAPFLGRLSDRYGRKPLLYGTIIGSAVGYVLFGLADSLLWLFISRIFTGLMNGNISVAQAIVTDITDHEQRAKGLGYLGAAFGLGLILGPALGGVLLHWGMRWPAFAAAILNLLSLPLVLFLLPETLSGHSRSRADLTLKALIRTLQLPGIGSLLQIRFIFSLSFAIFATVFALYTEFGLRLSPQLTAYLLAYVGGLIVVVQSLLIAPLTRRWPERHLLYYSLLIMAAALAAWAAARSLWILVAVLIPLAFAGGIFNTIINSVLSKMVSEKEVGGILGISAGLESFSRILAPTLGGWAMQQWGLSAPGIISALLLLLFVPLARKQLLSVKKNISKE